MNQISDDMVSRCLLANLREAVDALFELAESETNRNSLLTLVQNTIKDEFQKAARKICEQINDLVRKYNDRECVTAGVSPEEKVQSDENLYLHTGSIMWMDIKKIGIRKIGIRRIGNTAAYQLTIDDEEVPGTGMPDELAKRLYKAIVAFRNARLNKEKEPC